MTVIETQLQQHNDYLQHLKLEGAIGSITAEERAWLPSIPATASDESIRHELETKGVVHIKGVMPREFVLEARRKYFEWVEPTHILKEGTDPKEGIWAAGDRDPNHFVPPAGAGYIEMNPQAAVYIDRAWDMLDEEWPKDFCSNQYIKTMVTRIHHDWHEPFCFKRQIWRTNVPHAKGTSTGVHYDHIFLRGGPPTAITAWVPVGDCTPEMGGLMYLENSIPIAQKIEDDFTELGKAKGFTEDDLVYAFNSNMDATGMLSMDPGTFGRQFGENRKWLIGDYEAGDIVFHHSMMIHASGSNLDPQGRIRLSTDLRYGDRNHPYDARWDQDRMRPGDRL